MRLTIIVIIDAHHRRACDFGVQWWPFEVEDFDCSVRRSRATPFEVEGFECSGGRSRAAPCEVEDYECSESRVMATGRRQWQATGGRQYADTATSMGRYTDTDTVTSMSRYADTVTSMGPYTDTVTSMSRYAETATSMSTDTVISRVDILAQFFARPLVNATSLVIYICLDTPSKIWLVICSVGVERQAFLDYSEIWLLKIKCQWWCTTKSKFLMLK